MDESKQNQRLFKQRAINYYSTCLHCEKCGHSLQVIRRNKAFCEWCGRYIFKNKKELLEKYEPKKIIYMHIEGKIDLRAKQIDKLIKMKKVEK